MHARRPQGGPAPSSGGLRPLYHRARIHPVHVDIDLRVVTVMARMLQGPRGAYSCAARCTSRPSARTIPPRRSCRIPARGGPPRLGQSALRDCEGRTHAPVHIDVPRVVVVA
ncbi:hypothetical protein B0H12DRAFT_1243294 [Mycena haematopus]|nr:hypothetical protein B0H12DRAFT_1243294 [Mycena haematopus]